MKGISVEIRKYFPSIWLNTILNMQEWTTPLCSLVPRPSASSFWRQEGQFWLKAVVIKVKEKKTLLNVMMEWVAFLGISSCMWYNSSCVLWRNRDTQGLLYTRSCYNVLSTVHTLHCDLDLQGKQVKRKRKRQAVDGEEDLTIGEK